MTSKTKVLADKLVTTLQGFGWKLDRFGHLHKDVRLKNGALRKLRVKVQVVSVRIEVRTESHSPPGDEITVPASWVRIGGTYLSDVVYLPDGRVKIGSKLIGPGAELGT